jgi:hypothetical protein
LNENNVRPITRLLFETVIEATCPLLSAHKLVSLIADWRIGLRVRMLKEGGVGEFIFL